MQMQVQMHPPQGNQMQVQVQMPHLHLHLQMQMHLSTSLVGNITRFLQATLTSGSLHISFLFSHVGPYIPSHCPAAVLLAFLVIVPLNVSLQDGVCQVTFRSRHMSKTSQLTLVKYLKQRFIGRPLLRNCICISPVTLHIGRMCGVMRCNAV